MFTLPFFKNNGQSNGANGNETLIDLRGVNKYDQAAAGDDHALKGINLSNKESGVRDNVANA